MLDLSKVTRLEVIDAHGRSYVNYSVKEVELSLQDEGRTLKVFCRASDTIPWDMETHAVNAVLSSCGVI